MFVSYLLQYLDKTTLGYAAVTGIQKDTVKQPRTKGVLVAETDSTYSTL